MIYQNFCRVLIATVMIPTFYTSALAQNNFSPAEANTTAQSYFKSLGQKLNKMVQGGDLDSAHALISKEISKNPESAELFVIQARLALLQSDTTAAFASLEKAVDLGFSTLKNLLDDPAFAEMQIAQGIGRLLDKSAALPRPLPPAVPAVRTDAIVKVGHENIVWSEKAKRFLALVDLKKADIQGPIASSEATGADIAYLRSLEAQGIACGLKGVLYDNRDRHHSVIKYKHFPQLTRVVYGENLKLRGFNYGLANKLTFSAITFGNSSTMYKSLKGGSLPRRSMLWKDETGRAFQNYISDHIYVYPSGGDNYPANWPYTFSSKGASGSDRWILRSIALILAAMPCETREKLDAENLVAPTVQMIFRRAQLHVLSREEYLSGAAHPNVFEQHVNAPKRMMDLAASLRPEDIPPLIQLGILKEGFSENAGLAGLSEKLVTTPSAIARIWRGWSGRQVLEISAGKTTDPNDRKLTYEWRLLRGDPRRVKIDANGDRAKITIDWHTKLTVPSGVSNKNVRVDIGVFANNGVHDSAPGFISVHFPSHQKRKYTLGSDGLPRLVSVNYNAIQRRVKFDPILYWSAPWEDQFAYETDGSFAGWVRKTDQSRILFGATGQRLDGVTHNYRVIRTTDQPPVLSEE